MDFQIVVSLVAVIVVLSLFPLFYFRSKSRAQKILNHFEGSRIGSGGTIYIPFKGFVFALFRIGQVTPYRGTYPVLKTTVSENKDLIICREGALKVLFTFGLKSVKNYKKLKSNEIYLISKNPQLLDSLVNVCESSKELTAQVERLLKIPYSYLKFDNELRLEKGFQIRNAHQVTFVGLNESIYEKPELLDVYFNDLQEIISLTMKL